MRLDSDCIIISITNAFGCCTLQEKLDSSPKRDIEGMGVAEIKYGDSLCFVMHMATNLWLSYQAPDVKSTRLGPLKRRVSHCYTLCFTALLAELINLQ